MLKIFAAALLSLSSMNASAGIMADLNSMFMSNSTAPTTITTQDRVGYFGGSFTMRTPVKSANIVSFDPPRLDAGCGGVDLYLGSFTFISSQQLVALFRQVAANAVGLAFKAAIDAISPSLGKLMTEFQTLLQNLNNLAKNTCSLAHVIVDPVEKSLASATGGDALSNNVANSQVSDSFAGLTSYVADRNAHLKQTAHLDPQAGNGIAKAIVASGSSSILGTVGLVNADGSADNPSDPNSLNNRVLLSLLGFQISAAPCSKQNQAGTANGTTGTPGTGMGQVVCNGQNTITLDSLVKGGGAGSASPDTSMLLWECLDPTGSNVAGQNTDAQICTQMKQSAFNYVGIKGWVNTMLFGVADTSSAQPTGTSIVGRFNSGNSVSLSAQQVAFIHQSGVPLIAFLTKTTNPDTRRSVAAQLEPYITSCITAKVGEALYRSANGINDVAGYSISTESKQNIKQLRDDYLVQQQVCDQRTAFWQLVNGFNASIALQGTQVK